MKQLNLDYHSYVEKNRQLAILVASPNSEDSDEEVLQLNQDLVHVAHVKGVQDTAFKDKDVRKQIDSLRKMVHTFRLRVEARINMA